MKPYALSSTSASIAASSAIAGNVQKSIHRMSVSGGKADQDFGPADFRFVPKADIFGQFVTPIIPRC